MEKVKSSPQLEKLSSYEKERIHRIQSNAAKLKAKGLNNFMVNKALQDKCEKVSKDLLDGVSVREDDVDCQLEVMHNENHSRGKKEKQSLTQTLSMADFLKMKSQERGQRRKNLQKDQENQQQEHLQQSQRILNSESVQKSFCAPRSMAKNATVKKIQVLRGQNDIVRNPLHDDQELANDIDESESSDDFPGAMTRYTKMRKKQALRGNQKNDKNDMHQLSEDLVGANGTNFSKEVENNQNEVSSAPELVLRNENAITQEKRHRGKTILANVHARTIGSCDVIILNESNQPVGPTKMVVSTFSNFLGTLARDSNFAPLNFISWRYVPTKEKIWEYVLKKWVLESVNAKWRAYKTKVKRKYYSPDKTIAEMFAKRPKDIPENEFRELLNYFDTEEAKEISKKNKEIRGQQVDMHTLGPISYAMKRHMMQQNDPNKQCPDVYMESS